MVDAQLWWNLELAQVVVSFAALLLSMMVVRGAWQDLIATTTAGLFVSRTAILIARERLLTSAFLLWIAAFLAVVSIYGVLLVPVFVDEVHAGVRLQAYVLRAVWRVSVFGFAFARWSTRESIRRELHLEH